MFLIDDLLLAPGRGAAFLFKELARKAKEEWLDDDSVKQQLQEIYALLENGQISDQEFATREYKLIQRLEEISRAKYFEKWGAGETEMMPAELPAAFALPSEAAPEVPAAPDPLSASFSFEQDPVTNIVAAVPLETAAPATASVAPVPPAPSLAASATALPVTSPPPAPAPRVTGTPLTMPQVLESAMAGLSMLKLKVSSVTSVARDNEGWRVTAELVERRGVPDTNDLLGFYELRLDETGNILRYERTRIRRRCDLRS